MDPRSQHGDPVGSDPVDVESDVALGRDHATEGLGVLVTVRDEQVPAAAPLDVIATVLPPPGEHVDRFEAQRRLGRLGMGRPDAADGRPVVPTAGGRARVEHTHRHPRLGEGQGDRGPHRSGPDDDGVVAIIRGAQRGSSVEPLANTPIGTSTNRGRWVGSVTADAGMPSSR